MAICEICNTEVEECIICTQCGSEFCEFCGDPIKKVCDLCKGRSDDDESEFEEEEYNEDDSVL